MPTYSQAIPAPLVESLILGHLRFSSHEFRMLLALAVAELPVTAWALTRDLDADYSHTKGVVRALLEARVVRRGPSGLRLETDATRWRMPRSAPEAETARQYPTQRGGVRGPERAGAPGSGAPPVSAPWCKRP